MIKLTSSRTGWAPIALLALLPLWGVGMFDRGYWTPDEPREAAIAWRMSMQADRMLPQLAEQRFLEKPPLSYWLSAGAMRAFGDYPSAARVPNLVYAMVATMAIGLLAFTMAGAGAASVAAIAAGSFFTSYQVAIWLAPDASLVAGCALALLGLYRGYVGARGRQKFLWYTLMHVGALIGFMGKSAPGWIFPAVVLLTLIVWERRWRELWCWELWTGLTLQILCIGAWIGAVLRLPDGPAALRVLFWNNLAGRFTDLHATGALDYAAAHQNWPGKYLVELPYHLFPWTLLAAAAVCRAWTAARLPGPAGTPWRMAIATSLPFLVVLQLATTARGIYAAPALLGFAILVGLWSAELAAALRRIDDWALRLTRYTVGALAVLMVMILSLIAAAEPATLALAFQVAAAVGILILVVLTLGQSASAQRQRQPQRTLAWAYLAFLSIVTIGGAALFPVIDQWKNLDVIAKAIHQDSAGHALAYLQPDETTIAMLDHPLLTTATYLDGPGAAMPALVSQWFVAHPNDGLVLIKLPGSGAGNLSALFERLRPQTAPSDGALAELEQAQLARLVKRYELPQGRRYALVASTAAAN